MTKTDPNWSKTKKVCPKKRVYFHIGPKKTTYDFPHNIAIHGIGILVDPLDRNIVKKRFCNQNESLGEPFGT